MFWLDIVSQQVEHILEDTSFKYFTVVMDKIDTRFLMLE
jgi:hypothetical protein